MRLCHFAAALAAISLANLFCAPGTPTSSAAIAADIAVVSPPQQPVASVSIDTGRAVEGVATLHGQDTRQQLAVTGILTDQSQRDVTRLSALTVDPAGIVLVDATGMVTPVANGTTTLTAIYHQPSGDVSAKLQIKVDQIGSETPVNFPNQVVPIFTKLSCNSGGCHGKASGQNGFKLSLLGFEPTEDFEHLVKEGRGRRLFPASPDRSLLLLKPIGEAPHGGGTRLEKDSHSYRVLRRWIAQGMPYGKPEDPTVARIEMLPKERSLGRRGEQQLIVVAHYTDGSTEDVTGTVKFEPNNTEMAEVSPTGLVKTLDLTGDVAIMARYQGQVDVFRATIPLGAPTDGIPAPNNFVDELVFKKLRTLGVPSSALCDDSTFLRRSTVDVAGRLPTAEETEQFLADPDLAKRDKWIDKLLASGDYADNFANKWSAVLRNKRREETYRRGTYLFHDWIRDSLADNMPYDQFVRQIVTASGEMGQDPPVAWYREVKDASAQLEDTAQLFLGLRMQCAKCHHHPFEKWSQQDYYGFAAFFSQVARKPGAQPGEERIVHRRGEAKAMNPKTGKAAPPTGLGGKPVALTPDDDPRVALVDWMTEPTNRFLRPRW